MNGTKSSIHSRLTIHHSPESHPHLFRFLFNHRRNSGQHLIKFFFFIIAIHIFINPVFLEFFIQLCPPQVTIDHRLLRFQVGFKTNRHGFHHRSFIGLHHLTHCFGYTQIFSAATHINQDINNKFNNPLFRSLYEMNNFQENNLQQFLFASCSTNFIVPCDAPFIVR